MNNTIIPKGISLPFSLLLLLLAIPFHSHSMNKEEQSPLQHVPSEILSKIIISCNPAGRSRLVRTCTWFNQWLSLDKLTEWLASGTELSQGECIKIITHCAQAGCVLPHNLSSNKHYKEVLQNILYLFTKYDGAHLSQSEVVAYMEQKPENQDELNTKICNAIVNAKDIIGDKLLLHFYPTYKPESIIGIVLFFIAQNVNLDAQTYYNGEALLHLMCRNTYYEGLSYIDDTVYINTIELLLKYKADPNVKDEGQNATPLHYLLDWYMYFPDKKINATAITIAKLLLTYGADPNSLARAGGYDVSVTALSCACNHNDIEMAELLLAHGADPDITLKKYLSPLQSAHKHKNEKLVQLIAQHRRGIGSLQDLYYW